MQVKELPELLKQNAIFSDTGEFRLLACLKIPDKETVVVGKQNENKEKLEDIRNVIETSKDTEEKKTTIIEKKEAVSKESVIDNNTSNEEEKIKEESKATIRCIPIDNPLEDGVCVFSGKPSAQRVLFALAY